MPPHRASAVNIETVSQIARLPFPLRFMDAASFHKQFAIENMVDLIRAGSDARFVSNHDNGHTLAAELPENFHNLLPGMGIQRPSWLVD